MKGNGSLPVGAALVVGGGIGGMQAALDLADSGIKVYLLEKASAIGGKMAQLDKTFPTNDCAMCTISPKLVECGRHNNIEVITNGDLLSLEGETGDFTATLRRRARYVDEKCTSCGQCTQVCPIEVTDRYNESLAPRKSISKLYPQAVPGLYGIDKKGTAPCKNACPAGQGVQGYVALLSRGRYREALDLVLETNPLPSVCGRICPHPCEAACRRGQVDQPLAISSLKRFLADWGAAHPEIEPVRPPQPRPPRPEKVAVVGAGPGGLSAAVELQRLGYGVTVLEALPVAGGMLRVGVPEHRLPRAALQRDIDALGLDIRLNSPVTDVAALRQEYQAVFLAVGAHRSQRLGVPGEDLPGVLPGIEFLREANLGQRQTAGRRVAVIGGGNTAMDAARVALRLGAVEVCIVYRRSRAEMPADEWEIVEAAKEGVRFHYQAAPVAILGEDGRVTGLRCVKMELGEPDASGRRRPVPVPGSEFNLEVDTVIPAVSQTPELSFARGLALTRAGNIETDPETLSTSMPGVFAGGDVAPQGRLIAIQAIADGRRAALSIHRYLSGEIIPFAQKSQRVVDEPVEVAGVARAARQSMPEVPVAERLRDFREVELGYGEEQAVAEANRCLECGICSECYACVRICPPGAIRHEEADRVEQVKVGAVVLAPGYELYDARLSQEFGYGRYPNVVTSMQFERLLSASGPTSGHVTRPSDHQQPQKIAFLQCIGSRDQNHKYCSSVCCMYAAKEAMLAQEHVPGVKCHVFHMDVRAFGKGFDAYFDRARRQGVEYTRCRISALKEVPHSRNLLVTFQTEEGELKQEEFDLVVLSVGMEGSRSARELAATAGVKLNPHGFCLTNPLDPVETTRPGVFACGAFTEPKDIPDTVTQASGAAAAAMRLIGSARGTQITEKVYPAEIDISLAEPRVGVFVCSCGNNIAGVVDVKATVEAAKELGYVAHAENLTYACSADSLTLIPQRIKELGLNRIVVASCTPRTHEPIFQDTLRQAGLNPYLFEMANIRDQCSWVHSHDPAAATVKAKSLVRMAVARSRLLEPLHKLSLGLSHEALVIGGGAAGMSAALNLADQGFNVYLVEREAELGGNLRRLHDTVQGADPQAYLRSMETRVRSHPQIEVLTGHTVVKSGGFIGNFKTTLRRVDDPTQRMIEHGVTIVATGGQEYRGREYRLGQDERVLTQGDLQEKLAHSPAEVAQAREIAMIQCVGPEPERSGYCSRICCGVALKNALRIKEINPQARVWVLYKDLRAYGFKEELYTEARAKGVLFARYDENSLPELTSGDGGLALAVWEPILGEKLTLHPDLLVLSTAIVPAEGAAELGTALKVPLTREGFFLEAHIKLRPVDFSFDGLFLAGMAHYPKFLDETIAQAQATAARAVRVLAQKTLEVGGPIAVVTPEKCTACLTCVRVCPYDVPIINAEGVAQIEVAQCQGCGTCAAECPAKAIQLLHYKDEQVMVKTDALLVGVG